ncbi:HAD hydrolase-like protein [Curtobacterium ammoniigenes]|uniref:HAD hydrolase-like protein n=1 Tax=Curtobacterium ammoniigenes TaxID=395387 RepID=UPI00083422BD|nr:HAD hydrolase-like protein [Curtobacterium ammoniigenes]
MSTRPFTAVLFDLDGTISDSAPGIVDSLRYMLDQLELPVPPLETLLTFVGPPILETFRSALHMDPPTEARALSIYRAHYLAHGVLDSRMFPGIDTVIETLHRSGVPMSTATSKPETPATAMLERYGLTRDIDVITGASDDETRSDKADVVAEALRRLGGRGFDISRPVLIGDRSHDVTGAAANGVPTIFAAWGYGQPAEARGAIAVAAQPLDLLPMLLPDHA